MSELLAIRSTVASITTESDAASVADAWQTVERFRRDAKAIADQFEAQLLSWCETHPEGITIGDIRFYAGRKKKTWCADVKGALAAILEANNYDLDAVVTALASQPFADGRAKALVGDDAPKFWKSEDVPDLKEGKPVRELKQVNTRWSARKAG